jgi:hypothetical protein
MLDIEPCENYFYKDMKIKMNVTAVNFEKYNNCSRGLYTNYMLKNGKKCRDLKTKKENYTYYEGPFEPCVI